MTLPQHGRTCRRCGAQRSKHRLRAQGQEFGTGGSLRCPTGGGDFLGHIPRSGASQSFSADEIRVLGEVLSGLMRGGDMSGLVRAPGFAGLARKAQGMKASAERRRQKRETEEA